MGIVWTILVGFVIGVIAKFLHPGKDNMGFIATILLGVLGSFLAGIIGQALGWYQAGEGAGFIASVVVAIVLLAIGVLAWRAPFETACVIDALVFLLLMLLVALYRRTLSASLPRQLWRVGGPLSLAYTAIVVCAVNLLFWLAGKGGW